MSQSKTPTDAGDVNRKVEERKQKQDSSIEFGRKIGDSEGLDNQPAARDSGVNGSGYGTSGRNDTENIKRDSNTKLDSNDSSPGRRGGSMGSPDSSDEKH